MRSGDSTEDLFRLRVVCVAARVLVAPHDHEMFGQLLERHGVIALAVCELQNCLDLHEAFQAVFGRLQFRKPIFKLHAVLLEPRVNNLCMSLPR